MGEASESEKEILRRKTKVCAKCAYHVTLGGYVCCDHLGVTGRRRPCPGAKCVELGVYKPISKKQKYKPNSGRANDIAFGKKAEKPQKELTKAQRYYLAHKEEIKAKYQADKANKINRAMEWKKAHPEKVAEYNRRRREKRKLERKGKGKHEGLFNPCAQ